jgi:CS domain/N-terminal conserved domain of Nudc.
MSGNDDDTRFDGLYLNAIQQSKGIEPFLDSIFSFLRRKTDFFEGPKESGPDHAMNATTTVLKKHADLHVADKKKKSSPPKKKKAATKPTKAADDDVIELGSDGQFDVLAASSSQKSEDKGLPTSVKDAEPSEPQTNDMGGDVDGEKKKTPPPVGNGGTIPGKYAWTQTLSELIANIPVPPNTRGKDLDVVIAKQHFKAGLRGQPPIVDGTLTHAVICDDSFWTVEDGNRLVVNLQKLNQMEWWSAVCEGDPPIDVKTIQPENSSLADLDGETRTTVEKMMYDQRQKAMGKPTSEEAEKFALLEKFKQQHPEMDFSNAKFS